MIVRCGSLFLQGVRCFSCSLMRLPRQGLTLLRSSPRIQAWIIHLLEPLDSERPVRLSASPNATISQPCMVPLQPQPRTTLDPRRRSAPKSPSGRDCWLLSRKRRRRCPLRSRACGMTCMAAACSLLTPCARCFAVLVCEERRVDRTAPGRLTNER